MRIEFNPLTAMIGAISDCLLSARPRQVFDRVDCC
jgi:hypothetical protein